FSKRQIIAIMAGLRFQQRKIELAELSIQMRRKTGESLTGAGFDNGADNQDIHQSPWLRGPCRLSQALGIACRRQRRVGDSPLFHKPEYLLEMPQFLPRQTRHLI